MEGPTEGQMEGADGGADGGQMEGHDNVLNGLCDRCLLWFTHKAAERVVGAARLRG